VYVGAGAYLKRCIVDKNVRIPPGERIGFDAAADAARYTVSESGITVVPKDYRFLTPRTALYTPRGQDIGSQQALNIVKIL
jgi:ADP-glucose pyrophosphorylase